jgi:hypothetical protein
VATTRLHGSLYSLAAGRAPIAIDQVRGGAKVGAALELIRWPLWFRAEEADPTALSSALQSALAGDYQPDLERCRDEAIERSVDAVERAARLITRA